MHKNTFKPPLRPSNHHMAKQYRAICTQHSWERRKNRRYTAEKGLLAIFKDCAAKIIDVSLTGLAFQVAHFPEHSGRPRNRSFSLEIEQIDIWSPNLHHYLLQGLHAYPVFNRATGRLYPEQSKILNCRGGLKFTSPLTTLQLAEIRKPFQRSEPLPVANTICLNLLEAALSQTSSKSYNTGRMSMNGNTEPVTDNVQEQNDSSTKKRQFNERRQFPRLPIDKGVVVLLGRELNRQTCTIGDISRQGLSFYCEDGIISPNFFLNVSILVAGQENGQDLFMTNVWGKVVSSCQPREASNDRRYGLKFDRLNQWHSYLLSDFFA